MTPSGPKQLPRFTAKTVLQRFRQGSSSPVVVETEGGLFVAKLRGAGHGVAALVAELIVAELAAYLGLPVPERVLIDLPMDVESVDKNDELRDLLTRSVGTNVGSRFLSGAKDLVAKDAPGLDNDFAVKVLWLDGLVMNPDRSAANTNILIWNAQPWLIDHGACLGFQHDWSSLSEDAPREVYDDSRHLFADHAGLLDERDLDLADAMTRDAVFHAVGVVPDELVVATSGEPTGDRGRLLYEAFLWKRLRAPRPFVKVVGVRDFRSERLRSLRELGRGKP